MSAPASWASAVSAAEVGDGRRAVVDERQDDQPDRRVEDRREVGGRRAVDGVGVEPADRQATGAGQALEDVAVGRELVAGGHDDVVRPGRASSAAAASL